MTDQTTPEAKRPQWIRQAVDFGALLCFAIAYFVAGLHRNEAAASFYREALGHHDRAGLLGAISTEIRRGETTGPYGTYPAGPLTVRIGYQTPNARLAATVGTIASSRETSLPSAAPKPPGSMKSRCMSMTTSAVRPGSSG